MILKLEEFSMINESFKSKTITDLFKKGELGDENNKAMLNQITDDEILGIANDEEEAKKMIHDALGDKFVTRYKMRRTWHKVGPDDWDDDWEEDYDNPYTVNKTVDEFISWTIPLTNGKLLVLKVEKDVLYKRLSAVKIQRIDNKREIISDRKKQFLQRKDFVEKHKEGLKEYWKFKKFLEDNNILDEFVKTANANLTEWNEDILSEDDTAQDIADCSDTYNREGECEFTIGDYTFYLYFDADFDGNIRCWDYPETYWEPRDCGCEIEYGDMVINSIDISVYDTETNDELFDFMYTADYDKNLYVGIEYKNKK